jgi:hypothetical protein
MRARRLLTGLALIFCAAAMCGCNDERTSVGRDDRFDREAPATHSTPSPADTADAASADKP